MNRLATPQEILSALPNHQGIRKSILHCRNTIRRIVDSQDPRLLLIVGPCSIHDISSAREYALRLKKLQQEISSHFYLVMRTYFEKPRTKMGWKGFVNDPHLDGSHDIEQGIIQTRKLLLELAEMDVPTATEFLDPMLSSYYADLISWGCIGARTAASQIHRQLASSLNIPMGIKNTTEGSIEIPLQGMLSASQVHSFLGIEENGQVGIIHSQGNPDTQLVLRGSDKGPNYDARSLAYAASRLDRAGLPVRYLVDCSHDNSEKDHKNQPIVFQSLIEQVRDGNRAIRGILLESHLFEGSQPFSSELKYGVSLTDPCIDWSKTEELILWAKNTLSSTYSESTQDLLSVGN